MAKTTDYRKEAIDLAMRTMSQTQLQSLIKKTLERANRGQKTGKLEQAITNRVMGERGKATVAALRATQSLEELDKEISARVNLEQQKHLGRLEMEEASTEADARLISAREEEKRKTLKFKKDLEAAPVVEPPAPVSNFASEQIKFLSNHLDSVEKGSGTLLSSTEFDARINAVKSSLPDSPEAKIADTLSARRQLVSQSAQAKTLEEVRTKYPQGLSPDLQNVVVSEAATTGRPAGPQVYKLVDDALDLEAVQNARLMAAGVTLTPEGNISASGKGLLANLPGFKGAGTVEASALFKNAIAARNAGKAGASATAFEAALSKLKGARMGRLGVGGALAAVLLPMLLSRGKTEGQGEIPLPLQIQLMQTMASQQQQGALVQSLVGSRGAEAQKNQAQAEMLRLKAMQMMGSGGGGIL